MFEGMLRQIERAGVEVVRRPSRVAGVVVHASGALVRREVELGELPAGECAVVIEGLPRMMQSGSVRATLRAEGREILSVRSVGRMPDAGAKGTVDQELVRELERELRLERARVAAIDAAAGRLSGARLRPTEAKDQERRSAGARVRDALASAGMIDGRLERYDEERAGVTARIESLEERLAAAHAVALESTSTGADVPTHVVFVHLSEGSGEVERLAIAYVVPAARWWPTYTLRLDAEGTSASWEIEAVVAQDTGEDWSMVPMSLSTADLNTDATLPTLPALKLSKKQPPPVRSGFREPPPGLDRLFDAYDEANARRGVSKPRPTPKPAPAYAPAPVPAHDLTTWDAFAASMEAEAAAMVDFDDDDDMSRTLGVQEFGAAPPGGYGAPPAAQSVPVPSATPMAPMPTGAPMPREMSRSAKSSSAAATLVGAAAGGGMMAMQGMAAAAKRMRRESQTQSIMLGEEVETGEGWLDFDALEMRGPDQPDRGKLGRRAQRWSGAGAWSLDRARERAERMGVKHPHETRGHYDHKYDTSGLVEVPSDGALHKLQVQAETGWAERWWRAVPREEEAVFRMVRVVNPHEAPLLAGPVDVFVGGSFVLSTSIGNTSKGGAITLGLGVDERVRVARNARVDEDQVGLISSKTVVEHHVTTEVRSGLGFPITLELLDRVPVARDDDEIAVELESSSPRAADYTTDDEGRTLEGGLRWSFELDAGEEREVTFSYKMVFSAKEEIVGGNRREQ